jgi:iron complex outermembrane recepter protein
MNPRKLRLLTTSVATSMLLIPGIASAQQKVESELPEASTQKVEVGLADIVVTAQRRETNLQSTALAIASLSSDNLEARSINGIADLGRSSPSMDVSLYQGEAQVYIRGIGYTGLVGGTDSSTALHLNGVFLSRSSAAVPGFLDAERVEVVRGPQGTLYGRNATGGSVNIISKVPTSEWAGEASLIVGNYDRYQLFAAAGGPLASDVVTFRAAVQMEDRDGYTTVVRPGGTRDRVEDKHDIAARLSIAIEPSDRFKLLLIGDYYEADDAATTWLFRGLGVGTNPFFRQHITANGGVLPPPYSRTLGSEIDYVNKPKIWGVSARATFDLDAVTLTSLTAYRKTEPFSFNDLDLTSSPTLTQFRSEDHKQFSQEVQISSPPDRDFEWIVGLYYFTEDNKVRNEFRFLFIDNMFGLPETPGCCLLELNGTAKTRAYAAFGEVNYDITERLGIVLGGRYSSERRSGSNAVAFVNFLQPAFDNIATFVPKDFNAFTPKIGLNFQASRDVFIYASASRGFKSGGFNIGSYQNTPFNPEKIWAYEMGVRSDLLDRRLRLNMSAFYYDYSDLQVQDTENQNIVIRNAANAVIKGIELEATGLISKYAQIDFGLTYLDSQFKDTCLSDLKRPIPAPEMGCTGANQRNIDGFQLPRAPKLKLSIGGQVTLPLGDGGDLTLRGDYTWQERIFFNAFEISDLSERGYGWAKARITYTSPGKHWTLAAFIDNISDVRVMSNLVYSADLVDAQLVGVMAPPRTFGLQAGFNF